MRCRPSLILVGLSLLCAVFATGCGKTPPPFTEVEGTLLLDNQPLPFAQVEFFPELTRFGAEMNSSAVTDEKGRFKLVNAQGQAGAAVGSHRVVVIEGPGPETGRMDQNRLAEHSKKLTNRPIPATYGNYSQTPLRVDVKADQKTYTLNMTR
jgi:hypothetical protein